MKEKRILVKTSVGRLAIVAVVAAGLGNGIGLGCDSGNGRCSSSSDCSNGRVCSDGACIDPSILNSVPNSGGATAVTSSAGGASGAPSGGAASTDACSVCADSQCALEQSACAASSDCNAYTSCLDTCTTTACEQGCTSNHNIGAVLWNALIDCAQRNCSAQCGGGVGGASGTGGAGGTTAKVTTPASGGAGTGGTTVALAVAIQQFSTAWCNRFQGCAPGRLSRLYGTVEECITRTILLNEWVVTLPDTNWTANAMTTCGSAWTAAPCSTFMLPGQPAACYVFGNRANGRACNALDQCASGFCLQQGYSCGQCAPSPTAGTACNSNLQCGSDYWCMGDNTCRKPADFNQACGDTLSCRSDAVCIDGTCRALATAAGATCNNASVYSCDWQQKNILCSGTSCVAITFRAIGQTCDDQTAYCAKYGICTNGICTAGYADTGGDCSSAYCEWPAQCANDVCQMPQSVALCAN
jgi:hypothetical protein